MPSSYGGFNHVLLAVDSYSSFVTHIPIKSMIKPQRFVSALVIDAGHPIKQLKMDNQFKTTENLSYLDFMHIL